MSGTDQFAHELAAHLRPLLESRGFKYLKSLRAFRRAGICGHDFLSVMVTRFHNGAYNLHLSFGIRYDAIERILVELGIGKNDHNMPTVVQNSFNIHPNRPINYPGPTFWDISPPFDWALLLPEITRLVEQVVVPWFEKFADQRNLRKAVATDDGSVIAHRPWEIVAVLDILSGNEQDWAMYVAQQKQLATQWTPSRVAEFAAFAEKLSEWGRRRGRSFIGG